MNVDGILEALKPPKMTLHGTEYTGRYPGFLERIEIERAWNECDWGDAESQEKLVRFICDKVEMPADEVLALPEQILVEVMSYFLAIARGLDGNTEMRVRWSEPSESSGSDEASPPEQP